MSDTVFAVLRDIVEAVGWGEPTAKADILARIDALDRPNPMVAERPKPARVPTPSPYTDTTSQ